MSTRDRTVRSFRGGPGCAMSKDREPLRVLSRSTDHADREARAEWEDFPASNEPRSLPPRLRDDARSVPVPAAAEARHVSQPKQSLEGGRVASKPRSSVKLIGAIAALLAVIGAAGYYGTYWWTTGRFLVSTDDAYVGAYTTTLAAKISGYVASVAVEDNVAVKSGDVIATIDDGDYRLAVETARDKVATQQATIERIAKQIVAQVAAVDQAKAQLAAAQAGATRAQLELARQQALASRDFASRQTLEQAVANNDQAIAAVQSAQAVLQSAAATVDVLKGQREEAVNTLKEQETALAKTERDLSFAVIRAPFDGVIGNRGVHTGDYVQPGQRLASLVPLDAIYVDANFKETQLARLRPGQPVSIFVDAVPDRVFAGRVTSFAPASGSVFSLLPPDNATGNFTKIVQRVAVRVQVPTQVAREGVLRPGMSVVVSVDTKPNHAADEAGARQDAPHSN
jgi:membrane fusion protein, multidrug efflux system